MIDICYTIITQGGCPHNFETTQYTVCINMVYINKVTCFLKRFVSQYLREFSC